MGRRQLLRELVMDVSEEENEEQESSWLQRVVDGQEGFETLAVERFSERLLKLAAAKMSPRLARRLDAEDIVQSVFQSFFRRHQEQRFDFQSANDVWRLLAAMTYRKTMQAARHHTRQQRDINREKPDVRVHSSESQTPISDSPTGSAVAMMQELLEQLLSKLPETHHEILLLRLEQHSIEEIAAKVQVSTRTVNRTLALARKVAEEMSAASE